MSNNDVEIIKELFNDVKYKIFIVNVKRQINSKKPN